VTLGDVTDLAACGAAMAAAVLTVQPDGFKGAREAAGDVVKRIRKRGKKGTP
jgi:hypothetical protein